MRKGKLVATHTAEGEQSRRQQQELADAVLVNAPQPTEEAMLRRYAIYREVGGDVLALYEEQLAETSDVKPDESPNGQTKAA